MSTVLKMEHIEKVYGNQVRALHDISLEVSAGAPAQNISDQVYPK